MDEASRPPNWFLRDGQQEIGPLTEVELRKRLANAQPPQRALLQVRQGESGWHPAEYVLSKFKQLAASGIYLRVEGHTEGPFTAARAYELLRSLDPTRMQARIGREGAWVPAQRLWEHLQRAAGEGRQHASPAEPEQPTQPASAQASRPSEILEAIVIEELPEAILIDDREREDRTAGRSASGSRAAETVTESSFPALSTSPLPFRPTPKAFPASPRPAGRRARHGSAAAMPGAPSGSTSRVVMGTLASVLSLLVMLGLGGLRAYHRYQRRAEARQPSAAEPVSSAELTAFQPHGTPPLVPSGFLFRPTFQTTSGTADAGTAFAARLPDARGPVILSALHLLGPAGGLDADISARQVPAAWTGLALDDCISGRAINRLEGRPISLPDARPLPEASPLGDVLAFQPASDGNLQPLSLAPHAPRAGEAVWLLAEALNRRGMTHAAHVVGIQDGWLVYRFEDAGLNLQATSGAPVVNGDRQVVAINAGGGLEAAIHYGIGTPVTKFLPALQEAISNDGL